MRRNVQAGFTLIELLMVVLIIGLLASIAIPVFVQQRNIAKDNVAMQNLTNAYYSIKQQFYASGEKWPTAAAMATQAASDEPTYTYQNYNAGAAPSTGPKNMSISVEDNDMMTMCAKASTGYVYCLRADSQYNLMASTATDLSGDADGNLLASLDPTGLINPPDANAGTAAADYKGVARSTGTNETSARAALPTRATASSSSGARDNSWSYCISCTGGVNSTPYQSSISSNPNLVARWKFDETSGPTFTDDIGNNVGTMSGSSALANQPPLLASGVGKSVYVGKGGGTGDAITVPYSATLNPPTTWTIEAIVNYSPDATMSRQFLFQASGAGTNRGFWMWFAGATGAPVIGLGNGTSAPEAGLAGSVSLTSGVKHLAVTYNGTVATFYINGVASGTFTGAYSPNLTAPLTIGRGGTGLGGPGFVDEFAIYNTALSPSTITSHYTQSN